MKILICDDAAFMRNVLGGMLRDLGHEIVGEAANGDEVLERYKALKPDLVTMDITMPVTDGIEGVRKVMEYDKSAKIIMCSAMGQKTMVLDAMKAGAKDFIVKPFDSSRVEEAIRKLS